MRIGDWIKFRFVYTGHDLNHKRAVNLGEDIIIRSDGVHVVNFKILPIGASKTMIIDRSMLKYMEVVDESG